MLFQQNSLETGPKGRKIASVYFLCQGIASLLAWNAVLSTLDYYHKQFPDGNVYFTFPAAFSVVTILINFIMVWISKKISLNIRVAGCLFLQLILLIVLPIISTFLQKSQTGYWLVIVMLISIGTVNQVTNSSIVGLAGYFPSFYMSQQTTGTGLGGILPNLLRMATLLLFPESPDETNMTEIFLYYGISSAFLLFCVFIHFEFIKSEYAKSEISKHTKSYESTTENEESVIEQVRINSEDALLSEQTQKEKEKNFQKQWDTFKVIKALAIFMLVLYIQTMMLFPGVMLMKGIPNLDTAWKNVYLEITFNLADTLGKFFTMKRSFVKKSLVFGIVSLRIIFYFTFIGQVILTTAPILSSIWFAFVNAALFGLTNGYVTSALFILGPDSVKGDKKEVAGFIIMNCLSLGILCGTFLAIPLSKIGDDNVFTI